MALGRCHTVRAVMVNEAHQLRVPSEYKKNWYTTGDRKCLYDNNLSKRGKLSSRSESLLSKAWF